MTGYTSELGPFDDHGSSGGRSANIRSILIAAMPLAAAIFVFGTIYGAGAVEVATPLETILSSLLVFSGSVQFATVGLLIAGATPIAAFASAAILNLRNLLLGAAVRGKLDEPLPKRAYLAMWLTDEATGLALTSKASTAKVLWTSGMLFYLSWAGGTAVGVLGASLASLEELASAVFPVLFVGLAALSVQGRDGVFRGLAAAALSFTAAFAFPELRALAPVAAAILVVLPGSRR